MNITMALLLSKALLPAIGIRKNECAVLPSETRGIISTNSSCLVMLNVDRQSAYTDRGFREAQSATGAHYFDSPPTVLRVVSFTCSDRPKNREQTGGFMQARRPILWLLVIPLFTALL